MSNLDGAAERGKEKSSPKDLTKMTERENEATVRYTIDFPKSLHTAIKKQATIDEDRSMKALIIDAVDQYLSENA